MKGLVINRIRKTGPSGLAAFLMSVPILLFSPTSSAATATAQISAVVLTPIGITKITDLAFGDLYPDVTSTGTISIDSGNNRSAGGAAALGPTAGTAAQFTVTGEANATYVLSLPTTPITLTSSSSNTMSVDGFVNDSSGTLNGAGTEVINVGATVHVGAKQAPGSYSGTFDVTVNYN
jgi:spore coat protein U-like protein